MKINYLNGDATKPTIDGGKYILHICNNQGGWGKGFVCALSKRWKSPEKCYRSRKEYKLGTYQICPTDVTDIWVVNMIAQNGFKSNNNPVPVDYDALTKCLESLTVSLSNWNIIGGNASVHMPKIGTGLGGGDWDIISKIIENTLCKKDIPVYVYTLGK